jgi:hypothetical protein
MRLPQFTADASLGRNGESYASVCSFSSPVVAGLVTPQAGCPFGCGSGNCCCNAAGCWCQQASCYS